MSSPGDEACRELPPIDERLVVPETPYEMEDGKLVYVAPADPPHAEHHTTLATLLNMHAAPSFRVAVDMLTRTSKVDDIAPDASVFPRAPDPRTGGRQLEHLAFEVVSTQRLGHAGKRARKLLDRGVRRVFAIDVEPGRVFEWSRELDSWSILDRNGAITDPALAVPLPIAALLRVIATDNAVARALLAKRNEVIEDFGREREDLGHARGVAEGLSRGQAEAVLSVLAARGIAVQEDQRAQILAEHDRDRVGRWLTASVSCASTAELLALA